MTAFASWRSRTCPDEGAGRDHQCPDYSFFVPALALVWLPALADAIFAVPAFSGLALKTSVSMRIPSYTDFRAWLAS